VGGVVKHKGEVRPRLIAGIKILQEPVGDFFIVAGTGRLFRFVVNIRAVHLNETRFVEFRESEPGAGVYAHVVILRFHRVYKRRPLKFAQHREPVISVYAVNYREYSETRAVASAEMPVKHRSGSAKSVSFRHYIRSKHVGPQRIYYQKYYVFLTRRHFGAQRIFRIVKPAVFRRYADFNFLVELKS